MRVTPDPMLIARFTRYLEKPMADEAWALDLAERLHAYDPLANEIVSINFESDDRIVLFYRCDTKSTERRTFVIPKWTPPEPRQT